jgi:hypothetical protein
MDAPEVDLVAEVERCHASVGDRIEVEVTGLDPMSNLVCRPHGAPRPARHQRAGGKRR